MITLCKEMRLLFSYFNTGTVTAMTYAPPSIDAALRSLKNSIYRGNLMIVIPGPGILEVYSGIYIRLPSMKFF